MPSRSAIQPEKWGHRARIAARPMAASANGPWVTLSYPGASRARRLEGAVSGPSLMASGPPASLPTDLASLPDQRANRSTMRVRARLKRSMSARVL